MNELAAKTIKVKVTILNTANEKKELLIISNCALGPKTYNEENAVENVDLIMITTICNKINTNYDKIH